MKASTALTTARPELVEGNGRSNNYVVILAGGKGERLWPLSTPETPKQVLPFKDGTSLLQATLERAQAIVHPGNIWIITSEQQRELITRHVNDSTTTILAEPSARNTAAAILYTTLHIRQQNPHAAITFLPADHHIPEHAQFTHDITAAFNHAQASNTIVLIGIKPTFPATGYGYIEYAQHPNAQFFPVRTFHEKPSLDVATQYLSNNNMLWNAGIFCAHSATFLSEFQRHAPELYSVVAESLQNSAAYHTAPSISVDHAIMEKSAGAEVLPASFSWSDVGNLDIFLSLLGRDQGQLANVTAVDAINNLLLTSKKQVALLGVSNLCIIETGDTLLVADRDQLEKIKKIVEKLPR